MNSQHIDAEAVEKLKSIINHGENMVFFGGAGVSTESGVPDFRSEKGLYSAEKQYGHSPETLLSYSFFQGHTETFFDYYKKNLIYRDAQPNKAHLALAALEERGGLRSVVTQNIDGLHQMAGSKSVWELHGSVLRNFCMNCNAKYDLSYIMDQNNCHGSIPKCRICGGTVRPDVVLYEEALDDGVVHGAVQAVKNADVLIVGGTSLVVYPAAGLLDYFNGSTLVLINKTPTQFDGKADLVISHAIGEVLNMAVFS